MIISPYPKEDLGELCYINIGKTPSRHKPAYWGSGHPWLSIADMGKRELHDTKEQITDTAIKECGCRIVPENTLLMSFKLSIGKLGFTQKPMFTNEAIASLLVKDLKKLTPEYLYRALQMTDLLSGTDRAVMGATLNKHKLYKIKIPLPPLDEQKRIAEILDKADAVRRKRAESLKLLDELLRATFLDMFGDPITNHKGWPMRKFEEFGTIDRGKSKHRPRDAKELYDGKYPFIQTGDVANCGGYIRTHKQTYSELGLKQSRLWPANTLCITIAANIAKTGILTFDACFPDSVVGFTPSQPYYLQYIRFVLNFLQPLLEKQAPQSAQKNINLEILSRLEFPIPTKNLLEKFAVIEKKIMDSSQSNQLIMAESDTLFHSLVVRAFKGEL